MAELVPNSPEKKPATDIRPGVGSIRNGSALTTTANNTNSPIQSVSASVETKNNKAPPAIEPGTRPIKAIFNPPISTLLLCFMAFINEINNATKQIGAGTYSGARMIRSGAATIARPKPIAVEHKSRERSAPSQAN